MQSFQTKLGNPGHPLEKTRKLLNNVSTRHVSKDQKILQHVMNSDRRGKTKKKKGYPNLVQKFFSWKMGRVGVGRLTQIEKV